LISFLSVQGGRIIYGDPMAIIKVRGFLIRLAFRLSGS
jgi:hypothetical protein